MSTTMEASGDADPPVSVKGCVDFETAVNQSRTFKNAA